MPEAESSFEIDAAGAAEAMNAAGGVEALMHEETGMPLTPPVQPATPAPGDAPVAGAAPQTPVAPEAADTEWPLDIAKLPAEVQPLAQSLLGDYTRKTQSLAEQRKQIESFGSPEEIQQAIQLRETLQDPTNWPTIHAELTQGLQQMGYTPDEAHAAATDAMATAASNPPASAPPDLSGLDDPEFAPLKQYVESTRAELEAMKSDFAATREYERAEQLKTALLGELTRQENIVRASNPSYTDEDVNAIYERAAYFNGNLLEAQKSYAADEARVLERYLAAKTSPNAQVAAPVAGGATTTEQPHEIQNFDDAHALAMERLRQEGLA